MHDVGTVRGIEESEHAEAEIDEADPKQEREPPHCQGERSEAAQIEADAKDIGGRYDGEKGKDQTGIDKVGPQCLAEAGGAKQRHSQQPRIGDDVEGKERVGQLAVHLEEESIANDAGRHDERERSGIKLFDLPIEPSRQAGKETRCFRPALSRGCFSHPCHASHRKTGLRIGSNLAFSNGVA